MMRKQTLFIIGIVLFVIFSIILIDLTLTEKANIALEELKLMGWKQ